VLIAIACTVLVFPFAAAFSSPTSIGYIQLPGVLLFVLLACSTLSCFFLCPSRPRVPKVLTLFMSGHALFWVLYSLAYYWLHLRYHA
jgi:hypothetical protein